MIKKSPKMNRRNFVKTSLVGTATICSSLLGFPSILHAKESIKVGYLPIVDHLAMLISHAQDNSGFKKVDVIPKMFKSWTSVIGALKADVIDAALLLSPLAMNAYQKGVKIKTVLVAHRNGSGITIAKNSNINSAKDLKGKIIAVPGKISTHTALLDKYLRNEGLSINDVITKAIAPPNMIKSMKQGSIDAFIVADPFVSIAESKGIGKTLILSKDIIPNHICCVLVVKNKVITNKSDAIHEWIASIQNAGAFIDKDKASNNGIKTAKIATKYMPHSEQILQKALSNPHDRIIYANLKPEIDDFKTILNLSQKAGILKSVNLQGLLEPRFAKG